jgi:hypothetical protein
VFGLFDHVTKRTGMAFYCTLQEKGTSCRATRQAAIGYDLRVDANHVHNAFGLEKKSLERNFLRDHESCEKSIKRARFLRNFS